MKGRTVDRKPSKEVEEWSRGRGLADELALHTVSGELINNGAPHYTLRWRAHFVGGRIWDRLLNWDSRSETEIRDAAKRLGQVIDADNEAIRQDGETPVSFNNVLESGIFVSEIRWFTDVHGLGHPEDDTFPKLLEQIGLPGWQAWEIMYVLALRMVDDAIRHHVKGQNDLAETLLLKALDETYLTEIIANGRHRNTEYLHFKTERLIAEKEKQFWLNDALKERQKEIASRPRANAFTIAIREFADTHPDDGWKDLLRFLLDHDSLNCRDYGETLEWDTPNGEHGVEKTSGLPARLSRARKRRTQQ